MAGSTSIDDATLHAAANDCRQASEAVTGEASKVRGAKENVAARWRGSRARVTMWLWSVAGAILGTSVSCPHPEQRAFSPADACKVSMVPPQ